MILRISLRVVLKIRRIQHVQIKQGTLADGAFHIGEGLKKPYRDKNRFRKHKASKDYRSGAFTIVYQAQKVLHQEWSIEQ